MQGKLSVVINARMFICLDSNTYEKGFQGSYAGACGFETRIVQEEEMSKTRENDGGLTEFC